jgi:hypothetical protein
MKSRDPKMHLEMGENLFEDWNAIDHIVESREPHGGCQLSWFMTSIESKGDHDSGEQWQHVGREGFRRG